MIARYLIGIVPLTTVLVASGCGSAGAGTGHQTTGLDQDAGSSTLTCAERTTDIGSRIADATRDAPASCSKDQDCTVVGLSNACYESCSYVAVSASESQGVQAKLEAVADDVCPEYSAAGCPAPRRLPCPMSPAACVGGTCRVGASCDDRRQAVAARVAKAEQAAATACSVDADCTTLERSTSCHDGCQSGPLSTAGAAALQSELDAIDREVCPDYLATGCTKLLVPCYHNPGQPRCLGGVCSMGN